MSQDWKKALETIARHPLGDPHLPATVGELMAALGAGSLTEQAARTALEPLGLAARVTGHGLWLVVPVTGRLGSELTGVPAHVALKKKAKVRGYEQWSYQIDWTAAAREA